MTTKTRPGIPCDYNELVRDYSPFIANEIRKRNTVTQNFSDIFQEVCTKLLEAKVIEKFNSRVASEDPPVCPPTMTVPEICAFLGGISAKAWTARGWAYRKGYPRPDGTRKFGRWMPDPINDEGYSSEKAIYRGSDIAILGTKNPEYKWRGQGVFIIRTCPAPAPTPYMFLNYLGRAIRNHFANVCRTHSRKWQDRTGDMMPSKKLLGDKVPQFRTAEGGYNDHWEDTIRDDNADVRMEAQVVLSRTLDRLASRGVEEAVQKEIFDLLTEGYTLNEAIAKSSLTPAKKRACVRAFA